MTSDPPTPEYLDDPRAAPDPEIVRLERALAELALDPGWRPTLPPGRSRPSRARITRWLLLVGGLAIATGGAYAWTAMRRQPAGALPTDREASALAWQIRSVAGDVRLDGDRLDDSGHATAGQWIEVGADSSVAIEVPAVGRLELAPATRLRVVTTSADAQRAELAAGRLHALSYAPPRLFVIDTPAAVAVDLGCAYDLEVDDEGHGTLRVTLGWVALVRDGREVRVPRGASCRADRALGVGLPIYDDAADELTRAAHVLEGLLASSTHPADPTALDATVDSLLAAARRRDSLTLASLVPRLAPGALRRRAVARLAELAPPPHGVDPRHAETGDVPAAWQSAIDSIW